MDAGAKVMERLIARNSHSGLGVDFSEHENSTLAEYVNHPKKERE